MTKIYEQAKDVHVKSSVIYAKDNMAYKDVTCSIPYTTSELKEAFLKGAVIDIPAGYYDNDSRLLLNPSSLSHGNTAAVNFDIPKFGKNKYPIKVIDEYKKVTFFGPNLFTSEAPNEGGFFVKKLNADISAEFGIEFGPETILYSILSKLGPVQKTISVRVHGDAYFNPAAQVMFECDGDRFETVQSVTQPAVLSLTTTGNTFKITVTGLAYDSVYIDKVQVELGSEATEYEEYQKYDTEKVGIAESIPDPT